MANSRDKELGSRVLVLAPTARDGQVTVTLLTEAGVASVVCGSLVGLMREMGEGAGALLLTEDVFTREEFGDFIRTLENQPQWSDIPILMLLRGGVSTDVTRESLQALRNVTLLERPAPMRSLVSAVQAAVRGRQRQYQIRDQLREIEQNQHDREILLNSERAARTEAERANRIKDEFLATVSHELRTPLNAILGWAQILMRTPDDPAEVVAGMEIIERNARLQAQLIEELLDTSRIISGKIRLERKALEAASVVEAAIESVRPAADTKGVRIQKVIDPSGTIMGDPGRVQQVMWNLLSNAVKFTPGGGRIMVTVSRVKGSVEIRVSDSGKGLQAEFIPHMFERFRQADGSTSRTHGGLGLGLAIVKHLVELHGGTVEAESGGEGLGSTFIVTFPLINDPAEKPRTTPRMAALGGGCDQVNLTGVRVMVVDDDPDGRRLTKRLLSECHAEVMMASSAQEAMALLESFSPQVLVSDIGMPEMDGYQFIQRVRGAMQYDPARLPAVAVTAFARVEDRQRALAAGYQSHVAKPVSPGELLSVVASLAGRPAGAVPRTVA